MTTIQRALGSSKTPVAMLLLSNVLNLFLAVLLVYGPGDAPPVFAWGPPIARAFHIPRMQVIGAAWATIIARTVTLCPLWFVVIRRFGLFQRGARGGVDRRTAGRSSDCLAVEHAARDSIMAMLAVHALVARAFTTQTDQSATTALGIVFRLRRWRLRRSRLAAPPRPSSGRTSARKTRLARLPSGWTAASTTSVR